MQTDWQTDEQTNRQTEQTRHGDSLPCLSALQWKLLLFSFIFSFFSPQSSICWYIRRVIIDYCTCFRRFLKKTPAAGPSRLLDTLQKAIKRKFELYLDNLSSLNCNLWKHLYVYGVKKSMHLLITELHALITIHCDSRCLYNSNSPNNCFPRYLFSHF